MRDKLLVSHQSAVLVLHKSDRGRSVRLFTEPHLFWHAAFLSFCAGSLISLGIHALYERWRDARTDKMPRAGFKYLFRSRQ
jgi:hypothetical protein